MFRRSLLQEEEGAWSPFLLVARADADSATGTDDTIAITARSVLIFRFHSFCFFVHAHNNGEARRADDDLWYAYRGRIYIIFGSDLIQALALVPGDLLEIRRR